jgi:hypothetical protein
LPFHHFRQAMNYHVQKAADRKTENNGKKYRQRRVGENAHRRNIPTAAIPVKRVDSGLTVPDNCGVADVRRPGPV